VHEPIDYERALQDLQVKRRRRRVVQVLRRVLDPRPSSPGQPLALGLGLALVGWLVPALHVLVVAGLVLLVFGFLSGVIQPRGRTVTWRNRDIELPPEDRWTNRVYYVFYRRSSR
jgi:hypothetical protein